MPIYQEPGKKTAVKLCGGTVVWEGVTQPGQNAGGNTSWELGVVFPPSCPDLPLLEQLANDELAHSQFRGVLPAGGNMPAKILGAGDFEGKFNGWTKISFKTTRHAPDVYDANGQRLEPMQYGQLLYSGQTVDVLTSCYEYNNKQKGIGAGLDAVEPIVAANAPQQQFGGGGGNTAGAFGGGQQQQPAGQQQQPQQSTDFLPKGPGGPGGPSGPGGPAAEPKYQTADGQWTRAELLGVGFDDAYVNALPVVP